VKEAEKIREAREEEKQKKLAELQAEYARHATDAAAVTAARERYLERQKVRKVEREIALKAVKDN